MIKIKRNILADVNLEYTYNLNFFKLHSKLFKLFKLLLDMEEFELILNDVDRA